MKQSHFLFISLIATCSITTLNAGTPCVLTFTKKNGTRVKIPTETNFAELVLKRLIKKDGANPEIIYKKDAESAIARIKNV